jgi:hypothetical protein
MAGGTMQSYDDLIELARICAEQARATKAPDAADELRRMAKEYERRAAKLNGGQPPLIAESFFRHRPP